MAAKSKGSRYKLEEPLKTDLAAFCVAHYRAPEIEIIREALRDFIDRKVSTEPAMRARYEKAKRDLLGDGAEKVAIFTKVGKD